MRGRFFTMIVDIKNRKIVALVKYDMWFALLNTVSKSFLIFTYIATAVFLLTMHIT